MGLYVAHFWIKEELAVAGENEYEAAEQAKRTIALLYGDKTMMTQVLPEGMPSALTVDNMPHE